MAVEDYCLIGIGLLSASLLCIRLQNFYLTKTFAVKFSLPYNFTLDQFLPSGIVVACVCLCVRPSVRFAFDLDLQGQI